MVNGRMQRQKGKIVEHLIFLYLLLSFVCNVSTLSNNQPKPNYMHHNVLVFDQIPTRRNVLNGILSVAFVVALVDKNSASYAEDKIPETFDIDSYLWNGFISHPMGVSGQAGRSRIETEVELIRDSRTGDVLGETFVGSRRSIGSEIPFFPSFQSPRPTKEYGVAYPDEIKEALLNHETIILDARNPDEIDADGHLSQYDNTNTSVQTQCTLTECKSLSESPEKVLQTDDKNATIVVFCKSGRRAATAKKVLQEKGYTGNIINAGAYKDIKSMLEV